MSQISLEVECRAGAAINDCFEEGIELAKRIKVDIRFKFNGVTCFAVADGDVDTGVDNYYAVDKSSSNQFKFAHSRKL